jgi:hypothetical protein
LAMMMIFYSPLRGDCIPEHFVCVYPGTLYVIFIYIFTQCVRKYIFMCCLFFLQLTGLTIKTFYLFYD